MPSRATLTLLASMAVATGTIYFVHHNQSADRKVSQSDCTLRCIWTTYECESLVPVHAHKFMYSLQRMRQGVERDIERQRKKEENRRLLEEQIELERKLKERDKDRHTQW